jgi:ADP-ribose pyrophosphatase YjhB (NUDIX family)
MRTRILALLIVLTGLQSFAQKKDKNTDNYSYVKLIISNAENKILLLKWDNEWEIPGARYNAPYTLSKFIDTLAREDGIAIKDVQLNGVFSVQYENQKKLSVMLYYTAVYDSGSLRVPAGCGDIKWFSPEEAIKLITASDMKILVQQVLDHKENVWSATVKKRKENGKTISELSGPFIKLH